MGENRLKEKSGSKLTIHQSSSRQTATVATASLHASSSAANIATFVPSVNFALQCAMNGDVEKLIQCFEDATDPYHESISLQINQRSPDDGRTPLDWAAILGHVSLVAELLRRGADANAVTEKGYTAAHFAAAWGQVGCLRALVDSGADMQLKNVHQETPRDIAKRYSKYHCVEYIDWADARKSLKESVLAVKDQLAAADKLKSLTKEEKTMINGLVTEQLAWLDRVTDEATIEDFIAKRESFEQLAAPVMSKLNADLGAEKPEKT